MAAASKPTDKAAALAGCMVFEALSAETREELATHAYPKSFSAGDLIFAAGDPGRRSPDAASFLGAADVPAAAADEELCAAGIDLLGHPGAHP